MENAKLIEITYQAIDKLRKENESKYHGAIWQMYQLIGVLEMDENLPDFVLADEMAQVFI